MSQVYKLKPSFSSKEPRFRINYEKELTAEQLPIVKAGNGPALVIAGAGSGKTRTVTYRVAYLVESGVPLDRILLVTFTNKAAKEMIYRVEGLLKQNLSRLWGGTFHHIGNLILRKHAKAAGLRKNFTILDRTDSKDLFEKSVRAAGINTKEKKFPKGAVLQDVYSYMTNTQETLPKVIESKYPHLFELQREISKVIEAYVEAKLEQNLVDFDDLLSKWHELLLEHDDIRRNYAERFEHILVDEYQDTNLLQAQIIDLLASKHKNLMVVGDDSQSIYSFRGAEFRNIIEFPSRYPGCQIYKIETNHRSTPEILNFANDSIRNASQRFEKNLRAVRKKGSPPVAASFRDVYSQAAFVAQRILELSDEGLSLNEVAVLYRSHYHCLELQLELTRRGIPFEVRSGLRLWEEAHIKDVLAYLKIFQNPYDGLAWMRVLKLLPKVGQKTAEKLWIKLKKSPDPVKTISASLTLDIVPKAAQKLFEEFQILIKALSGMTGNPGAMIETIVDHGYSDHLKMTYPNFQMRLDELKELENYALQYKELEKFLSSLALLGGVSAEEIMGAGEKPEEAVVLTTIHQAKGLEWKTVFVIWLAEGRFPSYLSFGSEKEIEEERRLFYVAVTRSKDQLYLTYPVVYNGREGTVFLKASRFLKEVSENRYEKWLIEEEEADEDEELDVVGWD